MTPAATTPGGRVGAVKKAGPGQPAPGHRRGLRQPPAPRSPRRVSGPASGRAAAPRPQSAPRRTPDRALGARAVAFVRALPDHALLDRIIRGRAWIPLLGVMLVGIVAMQVEVLKLGANMGRSIELSTALQTRNELLRNSVATLADDQRIERLAAGMGMVMPAPDGVGFLAAGSVSAGQAVANIHSPNPPSFLSLLSANGAVTAAPSSASAVGAAGSTSSSSTASTPGSAAALSPATAATPTGTPAATGAATASGTATALGTATAIGPGPATPAAPAPTSSAGQAASGAPAQAAPTQASPSQSATPATGGAAAATGG